MSSQPEGENCKWGVVPDMVEPGQGGAIVLTSSTASLRGILGRSRAALGYVASKHGLVG
ncbi:hypothetical protein [Rhodococcus sp. LB1]|uniref:hypothetical protein n=1 Tax=Rhodococcus sp. LB1 TaxID=1807499 RepID=UPI000A43C957|nr:hypothetical protein [Rhodococcus sp. LB1]